MHAETCEPESQINLARRVVYQFLAVAFADPMSRRWQRLRHPALLDAALEAAELLRMAASDRRCDLAPGELPPEQLDLNDVVRFVRDPAFDAEAEFQETFGLIMSKKHPPYESEYCPQTFSVYRAQVIADVAGFYRAFDVEPSRDMPERHDHIALELEFMAWLLFKEARARNATPDPRAQQNADVCVHAAQRFFRQHLAWWTPTFAHALRGRSSGFYHSLANVLTAFIHVERALSNTPAPKELVAPKQTEDTEGGCEQCCAIGGDSDSSGAIGGSST